MPDKAKPMPDYLSASKANLNAPEGITIEQYASRAAAALAQATVALVEQQARTADALETANLIALWSMPEDDALALNQAAGLDLDAWGGIAKKIADRLLLA